MGPGLVGDEGLLTPDCQALHVARNASSGPAMYVRVQEGTSGLVGDEARVKRSKVDGASGEEEGKVHFEWDCWMCNTVQPDCVDYTYTQNGADFWGRPPPVVANPV